MASSTDPRTKHLLGVLFVGALVAACSDLPSKSDSLEIVKRDIREEASCVLPVSILSTTKMQLVTKAACIPKEAKSTQACFDALLAANVTTVMPASYMLEWPDDVASKSLSDLPAYERRARKEIYSTCFSMSPEMREGRFKCGEAVADRVLGVSKASDPKHADVRYARTLTLDPKLADLDKACGAITRPPVEITVKLEKAEKGGWGLAPPDVPLH